MKSYIFWAGGFSAAFVLLAIPVALIATVTHDDALYQLDLYKARNLSGVEAGQIYFVLDDELHGAAVCQLENVRTLTRIEGPRTYGFSNVISEMLPFILNLNSVLNPVSGAEVLANVRPPSGKLKWTVVEEHIELFQPIVPNRIASIGETLPIREKSECEQRIEREFSGGIDYCIVSSVVRKADSGVPVGVRLRQPCIYPCSEKEDFQDCRSKARFGPSKSAFFVELKSVLINYIPE